LSGPTPGVKLELFEQVFEHCPVVGWGKRLATGRRRLPHGVVVTSRDGFEPEEAS
jgi:hypothetical protein